MISKKINYEWVKKLFNYGKYVFGTNISSMVFGSIDQFMLGSILPTSSVATFNAANRMSNLIDVPVASVAAIVFPQSAKRSSEEGNQSSAYLFEKSVGVLLALLLPALLFLFFFADLIILIIAGPKYFDAADILRVMVITGLFQPFVRQFGTVMDSIGKPKTNFYLILTVSLLNIVSNYLFITTFGTIGAAFGTLLTTIIFAVASQIILKNLIQVRFYAVFVYALMGYKEMFSQLLKVLSSLKSRLIR
jgi:O-antigen/teichoic acid export membrane protein